MKNLSGILFATLLAATQAASAVPLLQNGGFEAGLANWTVTDLADGSGSWFASSDTATPLSPNATVGPASGLAYGVSDQTGPGTHALTQAFTVASNASLVMLTFDMFVNSYADFIANGGVLDHRGDPAQFARVDLLAAGADPFDTGAGVLHNFYLGVDAVGSVNAYTPYSFDITALVSAGGTYQLRFAETDNQTFLNMGVDNVGVDAQFAVPEPGSLALVALGMAGLPLARRRRR